MGRDIEQMEEELRRMKKELKSATDAEEKSRKAMDELASVLRDVASEAREAKLNMKSAQSELKAALEEKNQLRLNLHSAEERLASVMTDCNKFKNTAERLRIEADETLAAWNDKEIGLVGCMRKVEEERKSIISENSVLQEDMKKLRDILKQAMAEAVAAKEEASQARRENSQLKDQLAEKDTALNFIYIELESLRVSEAAATRNLAELKLLQLSNSSSESQDKTQESKPASPGLLESMPGYMEKKKKKKNRKTFSFDLGCSGRRQFEDLVGDKATKSVRGGSNLGRAGTQQGASCPARNMSCRFPDEAGSNSLRKKALFKGFGEFLGRSKSSKSRLQ